MKHNLLSLNSVTCTHFFRDDQLVLDNQLARSSLGELFLPISASLADCRSLGKTEVWCASAVLIEPLLNGGTIHLLFLHNTGIKYTNYHPFMLISLFRTRKLYFPLSQHISTCGLWPSCCQMTLSQDSPKTIRKHRYLY